MVVLGVHAGDTLFAEVRDQHVEKFGSFLQNQAMALKESHANFTNKGTKKDLSEIHQFVKQIPVRGGSFPGKHFPLLWLTFVLLACCLLLLFLPLFATGFYTKSSKFDESHTPGRTHQGHNRTNLLSWTMANRTKHDGRRYVFWRPGRMDLFRVLFTAQNITTVVFAIFGNRWS